MVTGGEAADQAPGTQWGFKTDLCALEGQIGGALIELHVGDVGLYGHRRLGLCDGDLIECVAAATSDEYDERRCVRLRSAGIPL